MSPSSDFDDFSVTVIIVNYNGGAYLQRALHHLERQTLPPAEIIVVDNASTDGSADRLDLSGLPQARLMQLDENAGFARANNLAAAEASGEWLALLNPDTQAQEDWLLNLSRATRRHPGTVTFASAQIDAANHQVIDGAGDCYSVYGFPWRGGFGSSRQMMPQEGECFAPCGASALIRRDIFLEAGGFDESYFCYCEDVDLGYRLRLQGERCVFVPSAIIHHHGSAISGRLSDFTVRLGTRNRLTTYIKNTPLLLLFASLPMHILLTALLYMLALRKPKARSIRHGLGEALKRLPQTLAERRKVQREKTLSSLGIVRAMSWNPMRLGRRLSHVWAVGSFPRKMGGTSKTPPSIK